MLEVSRGKCVLVSNTSDDNESMGKLFASNLKVAVDKMAKSNSYANKLAENIAELKIAALRVCTSSPSTSMSLRLATRSLASST